VRRAVVVTVAFCCAVAARAEPPAAGAYRGTVGDDAVSVCLGGDRPQFYREKVGKTVDLEQLPRPGAFLESEPSHPRFAQDFDDSTEGWWELREGKGTPLSGVRHAEKEVRGERPLVVLDEVQVRRRDLQALREIGLRQAFLAAKRADFGSESCRQIISLRDGAAPVRP